MNVDTVPLVDSATVSGGGALLPATSNIVTTQFGILPAFSISKTGPATATEGENITYTITITDRGDAATVGAISVVDVLPAALSYVSGSGTNGFTCGNLLLTVTCSSSSALAAGAGATIELVTTANALGSIVNVATVSGGGALLPAISLDVNTLISGLPAFSISKTGPATATEGENITYTITITDRGDAATVGAISVVDVLPAALSYVSGSGTNGFTCGNLLLTVTCSSSSALAAGAGATIELVTTANALGSIVNVATVSGGGALLPAISLDVNTLISGLPAFSISKTGPATATEGENITYTITITNRGDAATVGAISVVDVLPAALSYVSGSGTNGFTCGNLLLTVTCSSSSALAAGAGATIELVTTANALGSIVNVATVSGGGALLPAISLDVNTLISGLPAFSISLDGPDVATQGNLFTYTITITNSGKAATVGTISVVDQLPIGVDYLHGNGTNGFTCSESLSLVTCNSDNVLGVGASAIIQLQVNPTGIGLSPIVQVSPVN